MKIQKVIEHKQWDKINATTICPVCGKIIGLQAACLDGAQGLAWFDPYNKTVQFLKGHKGAYVCHGCLSQKRKDEIAAEEKQLLAEDKALKA